MNTLINVNTLAAMLKIAAKKDIRAYLMGVHIVSGPDGVLVEASNGHIAARWLEHPEPHAAGETIIGRATVEQIIKMCKATNTNAVTLRRGDAGFSVAEHNGGEVIFIPLDCVYPNISKVMPKTLSLAGAPTISAEYLAAMLGCIELLAPKTKSKYDRSVQIMPNGAEQAMVIASPALGDRFVGVIMPIRNEIIPAMPSVAQFGEAAQPLAA